MDLFNSGYEHFTTPSPPRKDKVSKIQKEFRLNKEELFHSNLYGDWPVSFSTPLPVLAPYRGDIHTRYVPFNIAYANKDYDCTVYFFIDDLLFVRVLRHPEKYLEFFQRCNSVIGTDLSQYADMSAEDRYFSSYINAAFSKYLQTNGVNVIPNITWSLPDSYAYSWSSMPKHSVIAINCKGVMKYHVSKYLWMKGYLAACATLHPSLIIRCGTKMPCEYANISYYIEDERLNNLRNGR
ncbi:MAG: DUF4417 domain-containing protein [Bacteroidaceae bacterium]|nr:DUF4417 domain-containing protein [Bacteroidaceae bacterium]